MELLVSFVTLNSSDLPFPIPTSHEDMTTSVGGEETGHSVSFSSITQ